MGEFGREQADAAVIVLGVVQERSAGKSRVHPESSRSAPGTRVGTSGLELTFRERVVVGDVGPAEAGRPDRGDRQPRQAARHKKLSFKQLWYDGLES
jgi:hypothetical protein